MTPLLYTFLRIIKRFGLIDFSTSSPIVVAVSGGADSMALLHLLTQVPALTGRLHVATLDHGLRGVDGAADAAFVQQMAAAWGLPVTVGTLPLHPADTAPTGLEARARAARYRFLLDVAQAIDAQQILTAHHADDRAETVLMHLLRGGGMRGMVGLRYVSPVPFDTSDTSADFETDDTTQASARQLIRPLLRVTRAQIEAYCTAHAIPYRHDVTNDQLFTQRNRIRHHLMPVLQQESPQITQHLNHFAEIAASEDDYLHAAMLQAIQPHLVHDAAQISVDLVGFRRLHVALQRRFVYWAAAYLRQKHADTTHESGFAAIEAAVQLATSGTVGAVAPLGGAIQLRVDYTRLWVENAPVLDDVSTLAPDQCLLPADFAVMLPLPTPQNPTVQVALPDEWAVQVALADGAISPRPETASLCVPVSVTPDGLSPQSPLILRTRRAGDRFAPLGMGGKRRKLKAWMIDRKIPYYLRDHLPLLIIHEEIAALWVENTAYLAEGFRLSASDVITNGIYINVTVAKI